MNIVTNNLEILSLIINFEYIIHIYLTKQVIVLFLSVETERSLPTSSAQKRYSAEKEEAVEEKKEEGRRRRRGKEKRKK